MNDLVRIAVYGIAVPLPIATALAWGAVHFAKQGLPRISALFQVLAITIPMPIAFLLINGTPSEAWERLAFLTAVGAIAGIIVVALPHRIWRDIVVFLVTAALVTLALWPAVQPESSWLLRLAPGLGSSVLALVLIRIAVRLPGITPALALWAAAIGSGLAVVLMGQPPMGGAIAPIGASMLMLALANRWLKPKQDPNPNSNETQMPAIGATIHPAALVAATPPVVSTVAIAWMYMKVTGTNYNLWLPLLASFAVVAVSVSCLPPLSKAKPALRGTVAVVLVFIISLGAVGLMASRDTDSDADDPYSDLPDFMSYPID